MIQPGRASRHDTGNAIVRNKDAVEDSVVAAGCPHSHHVPGFFDLVAIVVTLHESVHNPRVVRVGRVHAVQTKAGPDWREATEGLPARELITIIDALSLGSRQEHWEIVARFSVSGSEHFPVGSIFKEPVNRLVSRTTKVSS